MTSRSIELLTGASSRLLETLIGSSEDSNVADVVNVKEPCYNISVIDMLV